MFDDRILIVFAISHGHRNLHRSRRDLGIDEERAVRRQSAPNGCAKFLHLPAACTPTETRVSRFLSAFDCGRIRNAETAESQFGRHHYYGPGIRAHLRDAVRRTQGSRHEPKPRGVPRARAHGRARDRRDLDRHPRSTCADGRARHRRAPDVEVVSEKSVARTAVPSVPSRRRHKQAFGEPPRGPRTAKSEPGSTEGRL